MNQVRESAIERAVCAKARRAGWLAPKWSSPGRRGVPDRLFIRAGRVIAIEFKAPGETPSALQRHTINELREAGLECHVIDSVEGGLRVLSI